MSQRRRRRGGTSIMGLANMLMRSKTTKNPVPKLPSVKSLNLADAKEYVGCVCLVSTGKQPKEGEHFSNKCVAHICNSHMHTHPSYTYVHTCTHTHKYAQACTQQCAQICTQKCTRICTLRSHEYAPSGRTCKAPSCNIFPGKALWFSP